MLGVFAFILRFIEDISISHFASLDLFRQQDVSNQSSVTKNAQAFKRVKSQTVSGTIGYSSSTKNSATRSTDELVEHATIPSIVHRDVSKARDVEATIDGGSKSLQRKGTSAYDAPTSTNVSGPVRDIDDTTDPLYVTAYVQQMYAYYRSEEHRAVVGPYLNAEINATMRAILVDWLCEVHCKWKYRPETFYLAVNIVDRYIAKKGATKTTLQLVGSCALLIATKYEEIFPVPVYDLVYVGDGAYDHTDVSEMFVCGHNSFFPPA